MKPSTELSIVRLKNKELFDLEPVQGIRAVSAALVEAELLVAGMKKLRKSYVMRHRRGANDASVDQLFSAGGLDGMRGVSLTLKGSMQAPAEQEYMPTFGERYIPPVFEKTALGDAFDAFVEEAFPKAKDDEDPAPVEDIPE